MDGLWTILDWVGRILFAIVFVNSGFFHLRSHRAATGYAQSKGVPLAGVAVTITGLQIIVGATMLMATLSLYHVVAGLSVREEYGTIFSRDSWPAWPQLRLYGLALILAVLVTEIDLFQRIFLTTSLTVNQWLVCAGVALTLLVFEEGVKLYLRSQRRES